MNKRRIAVTIGSLALAAPLTATAPALAENHSDSGFGPVGTRVVDGVAVTVSAAGSAEARKPSCKAKAVCFWTKYGHQGTKATVAPKSGAKCTNLPGSVNDKAKSMVVGSKMGGVGLWQHKGCRGVRSNQTWVAGAAPYHLIQYGGDGKHIGWSAFR
ncbi:peptidase inhibitor family I36 protein [Actinomadura litoris]|uniref:peptidase inhibitor family I36 protein n=1 Tax=Actinomadura litoris TaxID=2678616 RepID=UPI001FA71DBD|nr:peptidase inhibitor family I36 protein [Actinomadura litoris]